MVVVVHVGVDPSEGCALLYNNDSKNIIKKIKIDSVKENEIQNVKQMFDEIKSKIHGTLGCICLCLFLDYDNEIRKAFIHFGLSVGFQKIEIIDWFSAGYLIAISQATDYKPKNGDFIWIFNEHFFNIYQISNKKAKHLSFNYYKNNETFEAATKVAKLKKNPTVILYHNKINQTFFNQNPFNCKLFSYKFQTLESAALLKARIMANDAEVVQYDVSTILGQDIMIKIDETEIFTIKLREILPIKKQLPIKKRPGQKMLQILQNDKIDKSIHLPQSDDFILDIRVDTNGIYTTKCKRFDLLVPKIHDPKNISYNIGIDLLRGEFSAFNVAKNEKILVNYKLPIAKVARKCEIVLQKIQKQLINFDKNNCNIVFHVDDDCFNSAFFDYIKTCQKQGFQNISFISTQTAELLNILNENPFDESIETIAFISDRIEKRKLYCQKWKKINNIFKATESYFREGDSGDDVTNLEQLFKDSKGLNNVDKIFYDSLIDKIVFQRVFGEKTNSTQIEYRPAYSDAALLKAQIISNFNKTKLFDVENNLNRRITILIDDKNVFNVLMGKSLPFTEEIQIYGTKSYKICERNASGRKQETEYTFSEEIKDGSLLSVHCNTFGILSIDILKASNSSKIIPQPSFREEISSFEKEKKLLLLLKLMENESILDVNNEKKIYSIPEKLNCINWDNIGDIVGIDLGTSRCCAAVFRTNKIDTVALENSGERLLPSYIGYDETNVKCGQIVVDRLRNYSKSTVFDVKRIIGKSFDEIEMDESWSFKLKNADDCEKQKSWRSKILEQNNVNIQVESDFDNFFISPEEVTADLLKYIKQKVEEFQGKLLTEVVITIPAGFTKNQKMATYTAALFAGWKTIHLLPEPVAASFAYFIDRPLPNNSNMLLFDFGGGTLDVCIFKIKNDKLKVIDSGGNLNLGGRNFDRILINYFKQKLLEDFDIKISKDLEYKLMLECQVIKHNLTVRDHDRLDVDDFISRIDGSINITRKQFEGMAEKLLNLIKNAITDVTNKSGYNTTQIDKVLQVGGGSRMPMIKNLLKDIFPNAEHLCEEHPDEVVAIGAAHYASYLKSETIKENRCSVM